MQLAKSPVYPCEAKSSLINPPEYYYQNGMFHIIQPWSVRKPHDDGPIHFHNHHENGTVLSVPDIVEIAGDNTTGYLIFTTASTFYYLPPSPGPVRGPYEAKGISATHRPVLPVTRNALTNTIQFRSELNKDLVNGYYGEFSFLADSNVVSLHILNRSTEPSLAISSPPTPESIDKWWLTLACGTGIITIIILIRKSSKRAD